MKMFKKFSAVAVAAIAVVLGSVGSMTAHAATSPSLGLAASFSVLAGTSITNVPTSSIIGNVGLSPAAGSNITGLTAAQVTGTIYTVDATGPAGSVVAPATLTTAKNDLITAYDALAVDACGDGAAGGDGSSGVVDGINWTGTGDIDLAGRTLVPGVYCADSFSLAGAPDLTLSGGAGSVYIFRSAATIITSPASGITGGDACNVWWRAVSSVTLDTTTAFKGNILALTTITMDTGATLSGRALARNAAVTLASNTITNATCSGAGGALHATLHVVKDVENDDGDDQNADDFTLYVKLAGTNVAGSPALGVASPGKTYLLAAGTYIVSEDEDGAYSQSFSGACDSDGSVTLVAGDNKTCTITNDDRKDTVKSEKKKVTPLLPAAGIAPQEKDISWNSVALAGFLMLVSASLFVVARKRTI